MSLPTVNLKGKEYVLVKDRLKYFREHFKDFSLRTDITLGQSGALAKASIRNSTGRIVAEGHAFGSFAGEKALEKLETTSWGRALANFGIGIDDSVASADEIAQYLSTTTKQND